MDRFKKMSIRDLLEEYSYWDREWDNLFIDNDCRSGPVTEEEKTAIWNNRESIVNEICHRADKA